MRIDNCLFQSTYCKVVLAKTPSSLMKHYLVTLNKEERHGEGGLKISQTTSFYARSNQMRVLHQ